MATAKKARAPKAQATAGDKRERILRGATKVFARNGFYATRVSEIAQAAGVADGTIYLYFKNKDDVLVSIFEDRISRLIDVLRAEAEACDTVEERITRIVEVQLGLLEGQRDLAEVITVNLRQSSTLLKQYAAPLFIEYLDLIGGIVAHGQKTGVLRKDINPKVAARVLFGAIDGITLSWAVGTEADPAALRKAAKQFASLYLEGLRAR